MIAIIDYDMGNLRSVAKALELAGSRVRVTRDPQVIGKADKVVLPGVGAFAQCMQNLKKYKLVDILRSVLQEGRPFLGICLGFQLLFEESDEFGRTRGLGIFAGKVVPFQLPKAYKIPHMGWNQVIKKKRATFLDEAKENASFYFVHSYHVVPEDPTLIAGTTDYGIEFVSAIASDKLFACQFHPEKSQEQGIKILRAFVNS